MAATTHPIAHAHEADQSEGAMPAIVPFLIMVALLVSVACIFAGAGYLGYEMTQKPHLFVY